MRQRWKAGRTKPRRPAEEILAVRDQRRTEALARCIREAVQIYGPGGVNHALVSERLAIPLPFLIWKYPSRESLLAVGLRDEEKQSTKMVLDPGDVQEGTAIGRPLPGVSVQILGAEGAPLPDGEVGNISVRSTLTGDGYLWGGDGTSAISADGWSTVGDDGFLSNGELHLLGRHSDVINSNEMSVYPYEVELALASVPGVEVAVVVGTSLGGCNQRIMAGVVTTAGDVSSIFLEAALERRLGPQKLPRQYFILNDLPLTARGKVSRRIFAEWIQAKDPRARPLSCSLSRAY